MAMDMDRKRPRGKRFSKPRKKTCKFCAEHQDYVDYKDVGQLQRFVTDTGKILPRRATGTCAMHQRRVTDAIKLAREIALLPFVVK